MSGFLRRLASGVLREERAVHPAVGSLWSAPRNTEPIESFSEILASPGAEDDRGPAPIQPDRDKPVQRTTPGTTHSHADQLPHPEHSVPVAAFRPLVPSLQANAVSAPRTPRPAEHNEPLVPVLPTAPPESTSQQSSFRGGSPRSPVAPSTRITTPQPIAAREATAFARMPEGTQPKAAEPDIEIHIGRIEVLAVPPPPAQPAPRPARKSLDLGEYLGRDRRRR
jgi:hypothetical protein